MSSEPINSGASSPVVTAAHLAPSIVATLVGLLEVPIEKWLTLLGILSLTLQMAYLIWKWRRESKQP